MESHQQQEVKASSEILGLIHAVIPSSRLHQAIKFNSTEICIYVEEYLLLITSALYLPLSIKNSPSVLQVLRHIIHTTTELYLAIWSFCPQMKQIRQLITVQTIYLSGSVLGLTQTGYIAAGYQIPPPICGRSSTWPNMTSLAYHVDSVKLIIDKHTHTHTHLGRLQQYMHDDIVCRIARL